MSWEVGFGEEVEGREVGRGGAGMRTMVLIRVWVDGVLGWTGLQAPDTRGEETAVSGPDTLSTDNG